MTNSEYVAKRMQRRCPGSHHHVPLMNGRARKAQVYTQEFCEEVIKGLKEQLVCDGVWDRRGNYVMAEDDYMFTFPTEEMEDLEDDLENEVARAGATAELARGEASSSREPTKEEQAAILKLHKGIGHPGLAEFIRFMKAARVKSELVRWAAKNFKCEACESRPKTKAVRPATIPKTYQPNKVIGIDLIYIPAVGGQQLQPALSILDWGSNYQMVPLV